MFIYKGDIYSIHRYILYSVRNNNTSFPNYILEFRNTKSHLLKVYLGAGAKKLSSKFKSG